ncbi:MAG: RluA family pseudouridine synthase [Candidatus Levybacteria bacterium]|nr:RluA family pseudouridine synthase [Candidatus Levybacteria bacterium]
MEPRIIFEDENLLVVDKPAGVIVNKADSAKGFVTLQDWVETKFAIQKSKKLSDQEKSKYIVDGYNKYDEFISRSGIVHRLDKETSGIILIAKNPETFVNLQNQFKSGIVSKTYTTLVHGKVENKTGEIDAPIGRLPWNRMRFGVFPEGRSAQSEYKVLSYKQHATGKTQEILTLVEVYPKTGRTHQIRVHFQYLKHPVFGDELYAGRKTGRLDRQDLDRHFLHASKIHIIHPTTNLATDFESTLPDSLSIFLNKLTDA